MIPFVHVDADLIVYRAGFAAEKMYYHLSYTPEGFDEVINIEFPLAKELKHYLEENHCPNHSVEKERRVSPVAHALSNARSILSGIARWADTDPKDLLIYVSGPENFRDDVAVTKPYKGNREEAHKPVHGPAILKWLYKNYDVDVSDNEEADDTIAKAHYKQWLIDPESTVLVTVDKDLNMIPGYHYNFVKDESTCIDAYDADLFFWHQMITGDSTDNIQGLKGRGKKYADNLFEFCSGDIEEIEAMVLDEYKEMYEFEYNDRTWKDVANEMAQLLWMRREDNERRIVVL